MNHVNLRNLENSASKQGTWKVDRKENNKQPKTENITIYMN